MEELTSITSELKEHLLKVNDYKSKEYKIFEHIKNVEKRHYVVEDFPAGLDWFNTSEPLTSSSLSGKIVVLDFFTYCCINCLHIIPLLRELEENFSVADGLVVVGVHSAKFDNEKDSKNILSALKRYSITHPVVNDKDNYMWNRLNVCCWPTILILGPQRQPIFALIGEGHKDVLLLFVKVALKYYKKSISSHPLPLVNYDQIVTSSFLSFPGKVTRWKNILAISDTGNHRILVTDTDGRILYTIGGKTPGFKDGSFEVARFNSPQGLSFYNENIIYIADTENHAIRLANLETSQVTTVVGNGHQGTDYTGGKIGTSQEISSPWDVCVVPCSDLEITCASYAMSGSPGMAMGPVKGSLNTPLPSAPPLLPSIPPPPPPSVIPNYPPPPPPPALHPSHPPPPPPPLNGADSSPNIVNKPPSSKILLIAAAGTHQIWAYFIEGGIWWKGKIYNKNVCAAVAGSGKEENRNNSYPLMASFAQPSGLAYSEHLKAVFIADSESSSIRKLNLRDGAVTHVVGGSKNPDDLFSYGDVDGKFYDVKLQHPMGMAWNSKQNCLYICDTYNHKIKKVDTYNRCTNVSIKYEKSKPFNEPTGCCFNESQDILFVADTNNNCLKMIRMSDNTVQEFVIKEQHQSSVGNLSNEIWEEETFLSKAGGTLTLNIEFTQDIHGKWKIDTGDNPKIVTDTRSGKIITRNVDMILSVSPSEEDDIVLVLLDLILCDSQTCAYKKTTLKVTVRRTDTAEKNVVLNLVKDLA